MKNAGAIAAALLEAAPDAMVCVTTEGRIRLLNSQAEETLGYRREDLVGKPVEILLPPEARPRHEDFRSAYLRNPVHRAMGARGQLHAIRSDGTEFPADISLSAVEIDDEMLVLAAIRDVSDRVAAEAERVRLAAEAEQARLEAQARQDREQMARQVHYLERMESLGHLASGVAHDFNNLLHVISSYTSFVDEEIARAEDGRDWTTPDRDVWARSVRADLEQISRAVRLGTDLTRKLLAFARREAVEPSLISVNEVIGDLEDLLRRSLGEGVDLVTDLGPDVGAVLADPGQIEQVLMNLAVNARDAMPAGGTLTNRTATVDFAAGSGSVPAGPGDVALVPGRYTSLAVQDTGMGIPAPILEHVFEPFFTTKAEGSGTGLGLSTVYGIVTQAGGDVRIASRHGAGTTVTALLPVASALDPGPGGGDRAAGGGRVILVVDDDVAMREVTRRMLSRNGFRVLAAASGAEAVELARAGGHVDVVLANIDVAPMRGREIVAGIRRSQPDVRAVFMSGYDQDLLSSQGDLEPGATFVEKPFTETALLDRLRAVVADRSGPA